MKPWIILVPTLLAACGQPPPATLAPTSLTTAAERGEAVGPPAWFTGRTTVAMLFSPEGARTFGGATVAFEPGARTAWHVHPAGQTLVVTAGSGWLQAEGEPRRDLRPGDVVWTPPGVRHWHGATAATAMTHIALQGALDGAVVDWQAQVTDAEYLGTP